MNAPLIVDGLHKRYGDLVALRDMTFHVEPGEIFGFVGSNGAGKSTTMRIILGVLSADAGEVRLGERLIDLDLRRRIGYMPEERGLYPKMKVGEQLTFLAKLHGMNTAEAEESVRRWTDRLGVGARYDDNVADLSSATSNASSSPPRSYTSPRSWCSTSRSPGSTRSPSM